MPEMPSCAPQTVRRDVVRRFAAAATSSGGRIASGGPSAATERLPAAVVGAPELRRSYCNTTPFQTFPVHHWGQRDFEFFGQKIEFPQRTGLPFGTMIAVSYTHLTLPTNREV